MGRNTECLMAELFWPHITPQTKTPKLANLHEKCSCKSLKKLGGLPMNKTAGPAGRIA